MVLEICSVGGYNEVGKNMTAINVDGEVVLLDMGLHLEKYIQYTEDEDLVNISAKELMKADAVPNINLIDDWKERVKAIIPTHAHLDHVGAIPFLEKFFNATILCTPFTAEVIRATVKNEKIRLKNKIKVLVTNSIYQLSDRIMVEFINITHSIPQTVMVALHTKYGVILYANDFKFDMFPTLGKKPDFKKLESLGKKGVFCLICDSTYAGLAQKTPSESVAKQMLRDVLLGTDSSGKIVIVTTFSSHIARLKSIIEFGKQMNRKIIFMGRSLAKYVHAAETVGIVNFSKEVKILGYGKQIKKELKKIMVDKGKYLLVVTGHQGEPKSVLSKMVNGGLNFRFDSEDHIVFSCRVIPSPLNKANREILEKNLKKLGVRIFRDIHQSGHAAREDLRDLINLTKPEHIIPAHGEMRMTVALAELAAEMGYQNDKIHLMRDGQRIKLVD